MKKSTSLHIIFCLIAIPVLGQVPDSAKVDTSRVLMKTDSLDKANEDSTLYKERDKPPAPGQVTPWKERTEFGSTQVVNDSLLRWQIWPNWGDYYAYRQDVISFRQGTIGRVDAFHINGFEPTEQRANLEGLSLNHPLTGLPNYNLVPHRKVGKVSESYSANLKTNLQLRDYYVTKPISYLIYDEAPGDYRNLEFLVSQNFTEATNLEISYWDRRGGGYYPNNSVSGSQAFARVYHHLNDRLLIRAMYLRNQMDRDEPFGYAVGDPRTFSFDEFASIPNSSNASSEFARWDLIAGIYQREDSSSAESGGIEVSITKNKEDLFFAPDTLNQHLRSVTARGFKRFDIGRLWLKGDARLMHHAALENTPISESNWLDVKGEGMAGYQLLRDFLVYAKGNFHQRNDGFSGYESSVGAKVSLSQRMRGNVSLTSFSRIPTMQSLHWNGGNYVGNSNLENETGYSFAGRLTYDLLPTIQFGGIGRYKLADNGTFITPDSSFTNSGDFSQLSLSAFGRFENHRLEFQSSVAFQQFNYDEQEPGGAALNQQDQIVWFRNSGFIKGYVFDRAAYLKLGVRTLFSPFYYASRTYNTELGLWQGNSDYQEIPPFFRLDAELSARVRGIMIVMRWENALDGIGQAGYFEAAGFPMPPRRLIVGIRAQFRN